MAAIEKLVRIFATTVPAFFPREKPISRNAKPACMNITSEPATITQIVLIPTEDGSLPSIARLRSVESARAAGAKSTNASAATASGIATLYRRLICASSLLAGHTPAIAGPGIADDGRRGRAGFL